MYTSIIILESYQNLEEDITYCSAQIVHLDNTQHDMKFVLRPHHNVRHIIIFIYKTITVIQEDITLYPHTYMYTNPILAL